MTHSTAPAAAWQGRQSSSGSGAVESRLARATRAVIGAAMPNFLRYFHRDPQVAAGPIALAATDMVTLLIYFTLARSLFG